MMSQGLRKLTSILAKTGTTIIFINQIRMKIGIMFGNPETTTGGNALKFYASQRIEIRRGEKIEEDKVQIGYVARLKIVKNKVAPPFKTAEIPVLFSQGYDHMTDIIEAALLFGLITKAGAFYTLGKEKYQGRDRAVAALKKDDKLRASLETDIQNNIKQIRIGKKPVPETVAVVAVVEEEEVESD